MVPTKNRRPSCLLVVAKGVRGLLDIGHTSIASLVEQETDLNSIDFVSISHFHTDHSADLIPLIHSRYVGDLVGGREHKELTVIGPKETKAALEKLYSVFWRETKINEKYPLKLKLGLVKFEKFGLQFETFKVSHKELYECQGIKISDERGAIVFTGDIGGGHPISELAKVADGASVLITEAGYPRQTPNHFSIEKIIELKEQCKIDRVYCVHIRDNYLNDFKAKIGNRKDIVLARKGLEIEI